MIYLLALITASAIGILTLRLILGGRCPFYLNMILGTALGLGLVSQSIFYVQLLSGSFEPAMIIILSLIALGTLIFFNLKIHAPFKPEGFNWGLILLPLLSIPLWLEAHYYPLGGWDAWSCWNLKAKFIYLGQEHWRDMLTPEFWRSNTNYPLALPTINVWFWQWTGFAQYVAMFNSILLSLLTAGVLFLGLEHLRVPSKIAALVTLAVFTLPLGNTLSISQYSDILFSLYLLSAFICYLNAFENKDPRWLILAGIFTGLLSFTKNEGLVAAGIFAFFVLLFKTSRPFFFLTALLFAALPEIIFLLFMAPSNEAFVNGISASTNALERLKYVAAYPFIEIIGRHWSGLWLVAAAGIICARQTALRQPLSVLGLSIALYLGAVLAYYQVNTFFEIQWWMKNTLNRILFALLPAVMCWMALSLFRTPKKDA